MKDSSLLDSGFLLYFWVKVMNTANYLQNKFSTKSQKEEFIPKEA